MACVKAKAPRRDDPEGGWTLIETLVVIGIILILASTVGFMGYRYLDKAKSVAAKSQVETYALALDAYYADCGIYPSSEQGLAALWQKPEVEPIPAGWQGPYVNKPLHPDPWGRAYDYVCPGANGLPFGLRSFGADGKEGGSGKDADVTSWAN